MIVLTLSLSGGSIVADFAQRQGGALGQSKLFALVRSEEQALSFSSLPRVTVVRADLKKEESIVGAILEHKSTPFAQIRLFQRYMAYHVQSTSSSTPRPAWTKMFY
jgi:hypothetical protein